MLSQEQLAQYARDGYVLVSGLIPKETIANAEAAMWSVLDMDPGDPASWSPFPDETDGLTTNASQGVIEHFGLQDPALLACCTPAFYEVQNQLAQENSGAFHCQNPQPEAVWTRSVFPVLQDWDYVNPHVDGGFRPVNVLPGSFRVTSLTYLDSGVAQGGGTVICPGSHRALSEAAMQEPDRYRTLSDFKNPQQNFDLGEPIELRPSRGDVLFFHYLLVHCGSLNTSNKPRFALRWMCTCEECRIWTKHGKWNIWMP
ncbi:MAG TPA: hypothetical protein EYQ18_15515 [Candidatus Handelsmanbacteria bacterium]|nr:hypothetical protein [Candidatus Handelsmanbacteria bacterium]